LLAWELFASIGIGAVLGVILTIYLRRVGRGMGMFLLIVALVIAEVGLHLHLDPLLVALAAGVLIRNATRAGEAFHDEIEGFSLPIYVLFFAVAGANLHLDALAAVGGPVLILVLVRASGMLAGARVGARLAGSPEEVKRFSGFGLLPQAGLALALSLLFARAFPEFGEEAGALTLGIVAMNELFAPVAYRFALVRSGEAGKRRPAEGRERPDLPGMEQASP
jgi:Kef-type K+ transport system membrane component KefB